MANPAGYNVANVQKQDGSWEIHGALDIKTATGGQLLVDGVDVTAGLEEVVDLSGLDSTELGYLNGAVAGTPAENKALILDSDMVTEIGFIDGAVAGTPANGKAFVTNTAQAAAITALMLECGSAVLASPTAEAANARTVSVQLNDRAGTAMAARSVVGMYLSSDANGDTPIDAIANDVLPTAGTDGAFLGFATDSALADGLLFHMVSEADGDIDVVLTNAADAAITVYLHVVLPGGKLSSSAAIAFADDTP